MLKFLQTILVAFAVIFVGSCDGEYNRTKKEPINILRLCDRNRLQSTQPQTVLNEPGGELFNQNDSNAVPANARLTYRHGALLTNVRVFTVFWGKTWSDENGDAFKEKINSFFKTVLGTELVPQLSEYNVSGKVIGSGTFVGTKVISDQAPSKQVTDLTVQKQLLAWIKAGDLPKNDPNTLYFIYLDPGIVSKMGKDVSCRDYCGYHNAVGDVYYALMPYPSCAGCLGGMDAFRALTGTSSHELFEAITDPVPGTGWYDDQNGEIGDICAWQFRVIKVKEGSYTLQLEWSNAKRQCI